MHGSILSKKIHSVYTRFYEVINTAIVTFTLTSVVLRRKMSAKLVFIQSHQIWR
jgi:hypothetical protein